MRWVVLGEPVECVQAEEPDRGLVAVELLGRFGELLGDAPFGRVAVGQDGGDLLVVLAAEGENEPAAAPMPAPTASPVRTASSRASARSVPGLAPLAMVSSKMIATEAPTKTAAAAASVHGQNEIGRHASLAPSGARRSLGNFMGTSSRSDTSITGCHADATAACAAPLLRPSAR